MLVRTLLVVAALVTLASCGDAAPADSGGIDATTDTGSSSSCMCNCPAIPGGPVRETRDDWPSCGIPGSGPQYAMCCGI